MRLASSVLLSALCIIALCCPVSAELKVGFIGGFSGAGKAFGDAARNGFELARTDLGNHEISVQYEDDQFDPKKTVAAFHKLTRGSKVDLIIVLGSTPAATISPLAERSQIPTIAWASNQQITSGRKWVIRSWSSNSAEGSALASKSRELNLKKIATLSYTDEYANSVIAGFSAQAGQELIPLGEVNVSEQNFLPIALQAKKKGVDSILTCLGTGQSARFAMQLRQIQFRPLILGCETLNSSREVELSAGALTGSWYASVQPSKEFRLRYTQRFNADTSIGGAAVHYELYKLLTELSPSNPSREEIRNKLLEIRARESVFGKFDILAQGGDQWFRLPITVTQITDK